MDVFGINMHMQLQGEYYLCNSKLQTGCFRWLLVEFIEKHSKAMLIPMH